MSPKTQPATPLLEFAKVLREYWSFNTNQQHTNSYHDREDFIAKRLPELVAHLAPAPAVPTSEPLRDDILQALDKSPFQDLIPMRAVKQLIVEAFDAHSIPQAAPTAEAVAQDVIEKFIGEDVTAETNAMAAIIQAYGDQRTLEASAHLAAAPGVANLAAKAQAVIDRWETPLWKDVPATGLYINELRKALAAPAQPDTLIREEWQPIETAPIDGRWVLAWDLKNAWRDRPPTVTVRWQEGFWKDRFDTQYGNLSHWVEIPAAPGKREM